MNKLNNRLILTSSTESSTLDIADIRLAGGSGRFEGRVEVQIDGVWGTICDYQFDQYDARTTCRSIGLK